MNVVVVVARWDCTAGMTSDVRSSVYHEMKCEREKAISLVSRCGYRERKKKERKLIRVLSSVGPEEFVGSRVLVQRN